MTRMLYLTLFLVLISVRTQAEVDPGSLEFCSIKSPPENWEVVCSSAIASAEESGDIALLFDLLNNAAFLYERNGHYLSAIELLTRATSIAGQGSKDLDALRVFNAKVKLAHLLELDGGYAEAEFLLLELLDSEEGSGIRAPGSLSYLQRRLATVYSRSERPKLAEKYYILSIRNAEKLGGVDGAEGPAVAGLVSLYLNQERFGEAHQLCDRRLGNWQEPTEEWVALCKELEISKGSKPIEGIEVRED